METIKNAFPIFQKHPALVYLDSAATTHKPQGVIDAVSQFYASKYATVHRAVYTLCKEATMAYEGVRTKVAHLLSAPSCEEILFTRGTTAGINLIAHSYPFKKGESVLVSQTEHHSNIVPWQMVAKRKGIHLKVIPANKEGVLDLEAYEKLLTPDVKLVSVAHVSNALGVVHPLEKMIPLAKTAGAHFLVDGAQATAHHKVDVQALDADFYLFSGHKMYGPTGIGVLFGKKEHLEALDPLEGGGDMIETVSFDKTTYAKAPLKFEAGTPSIAAVMGLGAAIDFLQEVGLDAILEHEKKLMQKARKALASIERVELLGPKNNNSSILSFQVKGAHPLDIATLLDFKNISIRTGHLCAQPTMALLGCSSLARLSFGVYNTQGDIDLFVEALQESLALLD